MDIDQGKVEQTVLALLYLTSFKDKFGLRTWKGYDWQMMNLLHEKGYIESGNKNQVSCVYRGGGKKIAGTVRKSLRRKIRPL